MLSCAQIRRIVFGERRLSSLVAHWPWIVRQLRHFDVVNVHGPVPTMSDIFLWLSSRLPAYGHGDPGLALDRGGAGLGVQGPVESLPPELSATEEM